MACGIVEGGIVLQIMRKIGFFLFSFIFVFCGKLFAADVPVQTHTNLQAVASNGSSATIGLVAGVPFVVRGVLTTELDEMLDPTASADPSKGGQFQVFVQAVDEGDRGGTALWMIQNYTTGGPFVPPGNDAADGEWEAEMARVMTDEASGHRFRKGDFVEVHATQTTFYGGKRNITENHRVDPANDFSIRLLQAERGVPRAEVIALADLFTPENTLLFDATRQSGGEYYQGMRVKINHVRFSRINGWGETVWSNRVGAIRDEYGRELNVRFPLPRYLQNWPLPATNQFLTLVGILNQEGSSSDNVGGYELYVQEVWPHLSAPVAHGGAVGIWLSADFTDKIVLEVNDDLMNPDGWHPQEESAQSIDGMILYEDTSDMPARYYRLRNAAE